jgi:hypothetical protein
VYDGIPLSYWIAHPIYITGDRSTLISAVEIPPHLLNDSNAVSFLVRAVRRNAWFGAAYYRKWVWPKLPSSLQQRLPVGGDPWTREGAAGLLGNLRTNTKPAVAALVRALEEDEDASVRVRAVESLGRLRQRAPAVIAALTRSLSDTAAGVRHAATNALLKIDPEAAARAGVKRPSP